MLWVSKSFEITEMEFSSFCWKPLSLRIKNHLAEKLRPAASLFKWSAAWFFPAVCGQIPHPSTRFLFLCAGLAGPQMTPLADVMSGGCALHVHLQWDIQIEHKSKHGSKPQIVALLRSKVELNVRSINVNQFHWFDPFDDLESFLESVCGQISLSASF